MKKQTIQFTKMQGLGNDYVYVDCTKHKIQQPARVSEIISDRHFGIGSDGLILILPTKKKQADFKMEIYNADGSHAEMCGNGLRCVGKYIYDHKLSRQKELKIETGAGILSLSLFAATSGEIAEVEIDMGAPILERGLIPVRGEGGQPLSEDLLLEDGVQFTYTGVSMGNPHAVIFVEDVDSFPVEKYGPLIENHSLFPNRVNVEFVQVMEAEEGQTRVLKQRTWERGSGETLACGTGACATVVAAAQNELNSREAVVRLRGGDLKIRWDAESGHVFKRGPAVEVFQGTISV